MTSAEPGAKTQKVGVVTTAGVAAEVEGRRGVGRWWGLGAPPRAQPWFATIGAVAQLWGGKRKVEERSGRTFIARWIVYPLQLVFGLERVTCK